MRNTNYYTSSNHTTFGGNIYNYDYDGYTTMSGIAARIESDRKFNERCKKNIEQREKAKERRNNKCFAI